MALSPGYILPMPARKTWPTRPKARAGVACLSLVAGLLACDTAAVPEVRGPSHEYRIERGTIAMPDGTPLAITWWIPTPRSPGERFPALLEMLPYRKDDSFYARDFPLYDWFASRGFLMAKVDLRGTGGSAGRLDRKSVV